MGPRYGESEFKVCIYYNQTLNWKMGDGIWYFSINLMPQSGGLYG